MYALASRFDRAVWPMHVRGRQVLELGNRVRTYRGLIPLNLPPLLANLLWGFYRLERLARRVPIDQPWLATGAVLLDQQTVGDWLRRNLWHRTARSLMQIAIEAVFAAHPDDVSLLHALCYLHAGGGLERLTSSAGALSRIDSMEACKRWLKTGANGWSTRESKCGFKRPCGPSARMPSAFRSTPTAVRGRPAEPSSRFRPPWRRRLNSCPPCRRVAWSGVRAMIPGRVIKGFAFYDRPFWRERGLCGQAVSDRPPVNVAFDATPPSTKLGVLLGFIEGRHAEHWSQQGTESRRQAMIEAFSRLFGPEAAKPIGYVDHD